MYIYIYIHTHTYIIISRLARHRRVGVEGLLQLLACAFVVYVFVVV